MENNKSKQKVLNLLSRLYQAVSNGSEEEADLILVTLQTTINMLYGDKQFLNSMLLSQMLFAGLHESE